MLTCNSLDQIIHVKTFLDHTFCIKDLGKLRFFLGFEIAWSDEGIVINQRKYTLKLLEDTGTLEVKSYPIPLNPNTKLSKTEGTHLSDATSYRRLIGRLLYVTHTMPDIAFDVQHLGRFFSNPLTPHFTTTINILKYPKSSLEKDLFFSA